MSRARSTSELSTTSYAVLGLLCVSDWSAYDLVRQMERSWVDTWPRAVSGIYREPKRLVARGYATERVVSSAGRRHRTLYAVTSAGRAEFRAWLATSCADPKLEAEALVRVLFAEQGTKEQLLAAIESVEAYGHRRSAALLRQGDGYMKGEGDFPDRLHVLHLVGGFHAFYLGAIVGWARWARAEVERWEGTAADQVPDIEPMIRAVADIFRANLSPPSVDADSGP